MKSAKSSAPDNGTHRLRHTVAPHEHHIARCGDSWSNRRDAALEHATQTSGDELHFKVPRPEFLRVRQWQEILWPAQGESLWCATTNLCEPNKGAPRSAQREREKYKYKYKHKSW
jgi:hypothetical protein